jgi:hypothetical protein
MEIQTETNREGDGHAKIEAEFGAKEYHGFLTTIRKAEEAKDSLSSKGAGPCPLDFRVLAFRAV